MAECLEAFERTLVALDAPIDRYIDFSTGIVLDESAMSDSAKRGFNICKASSCFECHKPPFFRDDICHNTGVALHFRTNDRGRADAPTNIQVVTQADVRAFKTPTWREIARTAPYFHAGSANTLMDVVDHYNAGGYFYRLDGNGQLVAVRDRLADPRIRPLGLNMAQKQDVVQFLTEGLSSPNYPLIAPPVLP
jgi:cytochrome c peroxidase